MNATIRAVVRTTLADGGEVLGVKRGYAGLIDDDFIPLGPRDVGGIIQLGGTVLRTSRCDKFRTDDGRGRALHALGHRVDGRSGLE